MRISEIIVDSNKRLLEKFHSDKIDISYIMYEPYQKYSNNFTIPVDKLYHWDEIHEKFYQVLHMIEMLLEDGVPSDSQIIIALNELLEYFNKK